MIILRGYFLTVLPFLLFYKNKNMVIPISIRQTRYLHITIFLFFKFMVRFIITVYLKNVKNDW